MKRLLIDISQILKADMHAAKNLDSATFVEFDGKQVPIPNKHEAYDIFIGSLQKTLKDLDMTPVQCVLVKDGVRCKEMRRQWLPNYCVRPKGAPEFMEVFNETLKLVEDTMLDYGAISIVKDGWEADDLIAAHAATSDCIIWSGDKDLLAAGDVYYAGERNPDKFLGIAKKHIVVYKSLVGDPSDKVPGAKGFGEVAFIDMITKYGEDSLDDLLEMLEDEELEDHLTELAEEFEPFKKILADPQAVYNAYKCVKFHHPGYYEFDRKARYPRGDGELPEWEPEVTLITEDKLTAAFLNNLQQELVDSPFNSLDIETYTTAEGKDWRERNKSKQGKMPMDTIGQVMTGFSITTGRNCHKTYYFAMEHKDTNNISREEAEMVLNMFPEDKQLVIQHVGFELPVIRMHFDLRYDRGWLPPILHDTKIMAGWVNEYELSGLKHSSKLYLDYDQQTYEDLMTRTRTVVNAKGEDVEESYLLDMNQITGEEVLNYGCDDTITTSALYSLYRFIMEYEESWDGYEEVDVVPPFIYSEKYINGVKFDLDKIKELQEKNHKEYAELYKQIQGFLVDLEWTESIEKPKQTVTIQNIREHMAKKKSSQPEYDTVVHRWPGSVFVPATALTPAEVKRLYLDYTGVKLDCRARMMKKLAKAVEGEGFPEFAKHVLEENLDGLNHLCESAFEPNPVLKLQSTTQMPKLMYEALGLPVRVRGKLTDIQRSKGQKQGNPSANADALKHAIVFDYEEGSKEAKFIKTVLDAKSLLTQDGLYLKPYQNMPHWYDGLVHPQYAVSAQTSGRGTATAPNDSQVSKDGELRTIYVPYDSDDLNDPYVWVSKDFTAQELLHIAEHCQDENMMSCFQGDRKDIHSIMGTRIYNEDHPEDQINYDEFLRRLDTDPVVKNIRKGPAKSTNFLKTYNGTEVTLALKLLIPEDKAKMMLTAHGKEFPGIDEWINRMSEINEERGYAVTPKGRRRHLGYVLDGSWKDKHELRSAGNHEIQGGAAEQVKLVLKKLWEERVYDRFDAFFMGTVHDELNSLVRKSQVIDFLRVVHPIMTQNYAGFKLEFKSTIEIGPNFGQLTEIGDEVDEEVINKVLEKL